MRRVTWRSATAAAIVGAIALVAVGCTPETQVTVSPNEATGISVAGVGRVNVVPDIALLSLGVEVTRPTVAEARGEAATAMDAVEASLIENGVAEADIQTMFFNIYPQYFYSENEPPRITGFTVSNQVEVKVRNIDTVSTVLDSAIEAGGDNVRVNNIAFTVDEPEQYLDQAREQAVNDARARAEQLATLAGVELGSVRAITESFGGGMQPPMPMMAERSVAQAGGDSSLNPGESRITLTVSVTYNVAE